MVTEVTEHDSESYFSIAKGDILTMLASFNAVPILQQTMT